MLTLLATLALSTAAPAAVDAAEPARVPPLIVGRAPGPRTCGYWQARPVERRAPEGRVRLLGELPRANHELMVLRTDADGCSVPVIVRRQVQYDGRFPKPQ